MQSRTTFFILFLSVGLGLWAQREARAQSGTTPSKSDGLVIIVNRANPISTISLRDLQRIYKAERTFWGGSSAKGRITVLMKKGPSPEREAALRIIYKMSESELKKFWLKKRLSGRAPNLPKELSSSRLIKRAVASVPNAIGYIYEKDVDRTVKALTVDGRKTL